jgi:signal transduction histidine kinase/ligand-binding sensor domain-containing protein
VSAERFGSVCAVNVKMKIGSSIAVAMLLLFTALPSCAVDPNQPFGNYIRTRFTSDDGLPADIVDEMVQSRDGFLWLIVNGTELARFDGRHFNTFKQTKSIHTVAIAPNGDLWIGTRNDLERISSADLNQSGSLPFTSFHPGEGKSTNISSLHFGKNGVLWVGTDGGLFRFEAGVFTSVIPNLHIERIEEASNGHLYLIITPQGFIEWDGSQVVPHPELEAQLGVNDSGIHHVFEDTHGATWFATSNGLARRVNGVIEKLSDYGPKGHHAVRIYEDPNRTVWIAKAEGLFRANTSGLELANAGVDVRYMYSDRDGDLWVGTNGDGLYRFKDRAARMFTTDDGLPNKVAMTVLSTRDGSLWTGFNCGGITRFDGHTFRTYNEKDGLLNSCVFALAEDRNGDLWVGTYGGGVFRFHDQKFTQYSKPQGLGSDKVTSILAARDGSVWIGTWAGVSHIRDGQIRNYAKADGLSNPAEKLYQDRAGTIWSGNALGLDRMAGDRFVKLSSIPKSLVLPLGEDRAGTLYFSSQLDGGIFRLDNERQVFVLPNKEPYNMVETNPGELWLTGPQIFRVPAHRLELSRRPDEPLDYEVFGLEDGLATTQSPFGKPDSALTPDGKLWIATLQGLAMLDLSRLPRTDRVPEIYVEDVTVGRNQKPPGHELVLPADTHHLELNFDAIEISAPEKIRLQYRLDGVDSEWLDAGSSGHSIYSNIPPGTHAFHVRASNRSGIWDRSGTVAYTITQQPYFYQTRWFLIAAILFTMLLIAGLYRLRVRQVAKDLGARFDERLAERTRVARELHDTFLQTVQGSKLVADHALKASDDQARMVRAMEQISEWLAQATKEGRAALNSLRASTTEKNNLAEAFRRAIDECKTQTQMDASFSVVGESREMHPVVRDEIYRVGYEAIRNSCTHSGAAHLEITLEYAHDLILRVSDNGVGMDAASSEKEGHFGLRGMRERAARIGGKFTLVTSPGSGTVITLVVPGSIAFRSSTPSRLDRIKSLFNSD